MLEGSPRSAIEVLVNGEALAVPAQCTVAGLLDTLDSDRRRVAVALNRSVVPRSRHSVRVLEHGDRIEILEAVGGG